MARARGDPAIMVHVGVNDIGNSRFQVLPDTLVEFSEKIRSSALTVVYLSHMPSFLWRFNKWLQI